MKLFSVLICRVLIAALVLFPFASNAALISTDAAVATAADTANRDKVVEFLNRDTVTQRLQTMGVAQQSAQERVAAMSQDEVNRLAANIDTMPAGAMGDWWIAAIVVAVVGFAIYYNYRANPR
jgi:hypothetical protein